MMFRILKLFVLVVVACLAALGMAVIVVFALVYFACPETTGDLIIFAVAIVCGAVAGELCSPYVKKILRPEKSE